MKPKVVHQEAMEYSYKAKQALEEGNFSSAQEFYELAANLESQVADFYFDKHELEPTRSIIIRSAAYLNIKAGLVQDAKRLIFVGLLNVQDDVIKSQLNNALEYVMVLKDIPPEAASREYNYLNILRQRSIHYFIEPVTQTYGHSVNLDMIKNFLDNYLKSLKSYALSQIKNVLNVEPTKNILREFEKQINPLVTSSAYGSFKFSIANDFLAREGEDKEILNLKANVVSKYHNEIFTNPLSDENIATLKNSYSEGDINAIFKPLTKIKSNNSPYKVGYYDSEDFTRRIVKIIENKQKQKLLTIKNITEEDIGELESSLTHKRSSHSGRTRSTTIYKEQLKSAELNQKTNQIEPSDSSAIILNEEIILDVNFDSNIGWTISFPDFNIESTNIEFHNAMKDFHNAFYCKLVNLVNKDARTDIDEKELKIIMQLIGNLDTFKKS